jgi:geranylgeranyl diphosphate synthase type II
MDMQTFSQETIETVNQTCLSFIRQMNLAKTLQDAIMYSFQAGGKRLRPLLLLAVIEALKGDLSTGIYTASSLELIHTSSLIHDDLPCMDDDDYRRGKLTNHKVFGEATAVLAGDALLVNAFQLIATDELLTDAKKVRLICELAHCSGANGMIGGQQLDIENEKNQTSLAGLMEIHANKTAKLLQFALVAGGIIAGATENQIDLLRQSAFHIGIAFQIKDDILDVIGDEQVIGKHIHSDEKNDKSTYVKVLGLQSAENTLQYHYNEALADLKKCGITSGNLEGLFHLIVNRNK